MAHCKTKLEIDGTPLHFATLEVIQKKISFASKYIRDFTYSLIYERNHTTLNIFLKIIHLKGTLDM